MEFKHSSVLADARHCTLYGEAEFSPYTPIRFKIHFYSTLASDSSLSNSLIPSGMLVKYFRPMNFSCFGYPLYVLLHLVDNSTNTALMKELK